MPNKTELVKLADLSSKGKISLNQAEGYLAEKGWKTKERNEGLRYIDNAKREHLNKQKANPKKSSFGFWLIILLIIGIIVYLFYAGYISADIFKNMNFKLPSFSK